ncbi:MAG: hypothetical protein ACQEP1_01620 [Nanobdellota archaeon]
MVRSNFKKRRYFAAFFITLGIFLIGLLLGFVLESKRVDYITEKNKEQSLDLESLQLQYQFLESMTGSRDCDAYMRTFDTYLKDLEDTRIRLERYKDNADVNEEDFRRLWRKYILAQLRYYRISKEANEVCDVDKVTVLYFFSDKKECPNCEEQAFVLNYFKKLLKEDILVFSIDANFEREPLVKMLKERYEVDDYPTLVIGDKVKEGLTDKDEILSIICDKFSESPEVCDGVKPINDTKEKEEVKGE